MTDPVALREFLRKAAYYHGLPRFERDERLYKLRLAHDLGEAADALAAGDEDALELLETAIKSPDDNLIDWRDRAQFLAWIKDDPAVVRVSLLRLWDSTQPIEPRLHGVEAVLRAAGLGRPGSQLTVVSTLLMVQSAHDHPPVRTQPFRGAFQELGVDDFQPADALAERYSKAMALLDYLVAHSDGLLEDRLDAQSVVWCIQSRGWGDVPASFDPSLPSLLSTTLPSSEDPDLRDAPETQRLLLTLARRGQGRFKEDLWRLWGGCALTGCRVPELVHAAHIKAWRRCSNEERLDPCNGLLLLPTLHAALDAGLLSFRDDGHVIISKNLSSADAALIGLRPDMRLPKVPSRTAGFLRAQRASTFQQV